MLGLGSSPNAKYTDKTIIYHLINAYTSQTSVNQISNNCVDALQNEPLDTGFVILIWRKFGRHLIRI